MNKPKYVVDVHCHTISSGHAYSTVTENALEAKRKGLELTAITDHAPKMPGSCSKLHFLNLHILPEFIGGIEVLKGCELNVIDKNGEIDLPNDILERLDVIIASLHIPCITPKDMTKKDNTDVYISVMNNPYVNIIGHPCDPRYPFDIEEFVKEAKRTGVLPEINNSSLNPLSTRAGSDTGVIELLKLCKKHSVPVILGSDAHYHTDVGNFSNAEKLLTLTDFPDELIVNTSVQKFKSLLRHKTN